MKKQALIVVLLLAFLAAAGYLVYLRTRPAAQTAAVQPASSLGAQIYTQTQNPVQGQVPDTNPFNQKTNPFAQ